MSMFSWYELLLMIGISQGLVTTTLLLFSKDNRLSNRYLACVLIAFCILNSKQILNSMGLMWDNKLMYLPLAIELALSPLFYLYFLSLTTPKFRFEVRQLWHFVPFFLFLVYAVYIYVNVYHLEGYASKIRFAENAYHNPIKIAEDYLTLFSIFAYLVLVYLRIKRYRDVLNDNVSDTQYSTLTWVIQICVLCFVLGLIFMTNLVMDWLHYAPDYSRFRWQIYMVYISAMVYYIGFKGYKISPFHAKPQLNSVHQTSVAAPNLLSDERVKELATQFESMVVEQKLHLNPTISAQECAQAMYVNQRSLSYAINQYFDRSFRDYINEIRIEEVKHRLRDDAYKNVSVLAIALECGFNSEASFYRIFKKSTGMSPRTFVQQSA